MTVHESLWQARLIVPLVVALITSPAHSTAQAPDVRASTGSRADLVARSHIADSLGRTEEAFLLRTRLREGDFEVGDKIFITIDGPSIKGMDSLIVRAGKVIQLSPEPLGELNLVGMLRSELEDSLQARVSKYYRNTVVHAMPLLRLSVSGAVRTPGFYQARPDSPLSDIIMRAGQDQLTDLRKTTIKRGDRILWAEPDVQSALSEGLTLDRLALDPGDEVVVGKKDSWRWMNLLTVGLPLVSSIALLMLSRR